MSQEEEEAMSYKEEFNQIESMEKDEFFVTLTDPTWIQLGFVDESIEINIVQARALRDWLNKAILPDSVHVWRAYCDCCAAPVPFDHVCSCETLIDEIINGE